MPRITKILAVLALLALSGPASAIQGSGTEADPYVITNVDELQAMQDDLGACYVLGNDIDACDTQSWNGGSGFEPIGSEADSFNGKFDGRGHTITGLYINRPSEFNIGLFSFIRDSAEVKNVGLADVNITGFGAVGALVGASRSSTISCAWVSGTVRGTSPNQNSLGGLVGGSTQNSLISQCFSTADVHAVSAGYPANRTGGLAGLNSYGGIIIDCYATGDVSGKAKVGGLVGDNCWGSYGGYIKRCYSTGNVTGSGGGLVGFNWMGGVTYDSYWDKQTSGKTTSYGGTGKTTAAMMQQATFVGWDFDEVWFIRENEGYPILRWQLSGAEFAIIKFEDALDKKQKMLDVIAEALDDEEEAYEALEEMLEGGDYGDLKKRDIVKAKQKAYSAMQHEERSADALDKSIDNLYDALFSLGWEPELEPNEPEPDPNLIAHWKFDEGSGTAAYDSAGDNDGTVNGATWTTGKIDGALDFDGVNDRVEVADDDSLTPSSGLTVSAWIYINAVSWIDRTAVVCKYAYWSPDRSYTLELGKGSNPDKSTVCLVVSETTNPYAGKITCGTSQLQAGQWYHVVGTFEPDHQEIYINGTEETDDTDAKIADSIANNSEPLYIGYNKTENTYFDGIIDDVRIYDRALSDTEIWQLYQDGLN